MKREFGVEVSFRQMLEETPTVALLCGFLDENLAADRYQAAEPNQVEDLAPGADIGQQRMAGTPKGDATGKLVACEIDSGERTECADSTQATAIIQAQLQLMQQQLQVLAGNPADGAISKQVQGVEQQLCNREVKADLEIESPSVNSEPVAKKTFGAGARVNLNAGQLPAAMQESLAQFVTAYAARMSKSKAYAQQHRRYFLFAFIIAPEK